MIAYRLGYSPDQVSEQTEPNKHFSSSRIGVKQAETLLLPCGVRFGEASPEQLTAWFQALLTQAGQQRDRLGELLAGMDLTEQYQRWYVLCELLERPAVRDVFAGKSPVEVEQAVQSEQELKALLAEYALAFNTLTKRSTGKVTLYAVRYQPKKRIYIGTQAMLEAGQLSRNAVMERLTKHGMVPQQEESEVA